MAWVDENGEERRVTNGLALLRSYITTLTLQTLVAGSGQRVQAGVFVPDWPTWNALGGPVASDDDDLVAAVAVGTQAGLYRAYRVEALSLCSVGGYDFVSLPTICRQIQPGAAVAQPYGTGSSASTAGQPSWIVANPPTQIDVSSDPGDACDALGMSTAYDIPDLAVVTVVLPPLTGDMAQEHQPEWAIGVGTWYPGGMDEELTAAAFGNASAVQWARWLTGHAVPGGYSAAAILPRRQQQT